MTGDEAIAIVEAIAQRKLELANAPRTSGYSRRIGEAHRRDATALAMVLTLIPEGARNAPA